MAQVTVYSSTNCVYCAQLKTYLQEQSIDYVEKNIDTNNDYAQELQNMGVMSLPLTIIGETKILGLNPTRIKKALAAAQPNPTA